jgi:hypothetical protein
LDLIYYTIKTGPDLVDELAAHLDPDHETASELQDYLVREGYFRRLTLKPGNLLGISEVTAPPRQPPRFLIYIYVDGPINRYQVVDTEVEGQYYPVALVEDWKKRGQDPATIDQLYQLPFNLVVRRTESRREP